jgi:hypothetical protein
MAEAIEDYPSGGYHACHGGARCRGTLIKIFDTDQYDRGDADTPKRLRRENVESSPPVAGARVGAPGGAAGEDAWSMVGTDRKAGHASLLWESVIAHLGWAFVPDGPRIRVMIMILLRSGHRLMGDALVHPIVQLTKAYDNGSWAF